MRTKIENGANELIHERDNQRPPEPEAPEDNKRSKYIPSGEYVAYLKGIGYKFRLCELDDSLWVNAERMTDAREAEIRTKLRDGGYPKVNVAADACLAHALTNSFHPIKDYLHSLKWDGQDHISELAGYFIEKHGNFPLILRKWLIGAVARPMTDGKQNCVMVLEGAQKSGKSTFAEWLGCPPKLGGGHYSEAQPNPDNKDTRLALATTWIWELKELQAVTRRADREALKGWLTMMRINERRPYGRHEIHKFAISSFIATVNDDGSGFFSDPTGSRRYMTVALNQINWGYEKDIDIDQIWAQAFQLFEGGQTWNLTPEEYAKLEAVNAEYEEIPPAYDWLARYTEPAETGFTLTGDILQAMKFGGIGGSDWKLSREISSWMKLSGYGTSKRREMTITTSIDPGSNPTKETRLRGYEGVMLHDIAKVVQTAPEPEQEEIPF